MVWGSADLGVAQWAWPGLQLGSRFVPRDSHPPWTSRLATHVLLMAMTGHKRGEQKHVVLLGASAQLSTHILLA